MNHQDLRLFNRVDRFAEGWYWALRSSELAPGTVKPVSLLGKELAVWRGADGKVRAFEAHCPHMGAHLAEGTVEGSSLRCLFHAWRFGPDGRCDDVPALGGCPPFEARQPSWPVEERYDLIWVWTGPEPRRPLPCPPELEGKDPAWSLGGAFAKGCHPNVVMINAIDAHHFNSVHHLPVRLEMESREVDEGNVRFANTTRVPDSNLLARLIGRFYAGPLTYAMSYWWGSNGTVTIGPDFLHFHILFALRMTPDGKTEGQTVLLTERRPGLLGRLVSRVLLAATDLVGSYFAHGDTKIFRTIRFEFKTPIAADRAILSFIRHLERQKPRSTGDWRPAPALQEASRG